MAVMAEPMSRYTPSTTGSSFKQGPTGAVTRTCKGAEAMAPAMGLAKAMMVVMALNPSLKKYGLCHGTDDSPLKWILELPLIHGV